MKKAWNSTLNARREKPRRKAPKQSTKPSAVFRCQDMRDLAKEAPHCMCCGVFNQGQVSGAHSNSLEFGKGMGQKAHDVLAFVCPECHDLIDGRTPGLSKDEKQAMWNRAAIRTIVWMFQTGRVALIAKSGGKVEENAA